MIKIKTITQESPYISTQPMTVVVGPLLIMPENPSLDNNILSIHYQLFIRIRDNYFNLLENPYVLLESMWKDKTLMNYITMLFLINFGSS